MRSISEAGPRGVVGEEERRPTSPALSTHSGNAKIPLGIAAPYLGATEGTRPFFFEERVL